MKKTTILFLVVAVTFGIYLRDALGFANENAKSSVFKHLKKGQIVSLKENANNYSIQVLSNLPLGHKILEIGTDYLVLEDATASFTLSIPVTSIKSISYLKLNLQGDK